MYKEKILLSLLFFTSIIYSQSHIISGVIFEYNNKPLESANIIAKPLQENASLKFAIADIKSCYRLELENNAKLRFKIFIIHKMY